MARAILLSATVAWFVAAFAGLALVLVGLEALDAVLPPLSIDTDALARTVVALALGAFVIGVVHSAVVIGLIRRWGWATSAGILLAGVSLAAFLTLAAASLTAGAAGSMAVAASLGAAVAALVAAGAYGAVGIGLARRLRAGGPV